MIMDTNEIAIAVYNPQPETNAAMVRIEMTKMSVVKNSLTTNEMLVLKSTTTRPFAEYEDVDLINKCRETFDFIAGDVGYNKPDNLAWGKILVRFATILKQYYPTFTADDVLMAFEFLAVGSLDAYLPKDSYGNPDRKHYQQFNVEYLSKVLNAYRKERARVIQKAQQAVPKPVNKLSEEEKNRHKKEMYDMVINNYLRYKYTGIFNCGSCIGEMITYNALADVGFVDDLDTTMSEQQLLLVAALNNTQCTSDYFVLRRQIIRKTFDKMIEDEVQIMDYLR